MISITITDFTTKSALIKRVMIEKSVVPKLVAAVVTGSILTITFRTQYCH